jgi:hypothetical protein
VARSPLLLWRRCGSPNFAQADVPSAHSLAQTLKLDAWMYKHHDYQKQREYRFAFAEVVDRIHDVDAILKSE